MSFEHLTPAKSLSHWFGAASQLALHEGAPPRAVENLTAQISLPRLLAEDHLAISELVRIAIAAIAWRNTWEALQADGWTDADLLRVQKAWERQEFAASMARSLEGERVFQSASYKSGRRSNDETYEAIYSMQEFLGEDEDRSWWERSVGKNVARFFKKHVYCRLWRFAWSHQSERHSLEELQRLIDIMRTTASEKSLSAAREGIEAVENDALKRNWYDGLRYPTPESIFVMSRVVQRAMQAETERSMTICAIALKRYSERHGTLPPSLDALVPEFVAAVPVDCMDGKPLRYRPNADGTFLLYSIGINGVDDNGDGALLLEKTSSHILWNRKDFIWPSPASAGAGD